MIIEHKNTMIAMTGDVMPENSKSLAARVGMALGASCFVLCIASSAVRAEDAPSNGQLYEMIKQLQQQQSVLQREAASAKGEARKAKADLAAAKKQLNETKTELARTRELAVDVNERTAGIDRYYTDQAATPTYGVVPAYTSANSVNTASLPTGNAAHDKLVIGYANVFLNPAFESSKAFVDTQDPSLGTPPAGSGRFGTRIFEFDHDLGYSPRAWLGYERADGLGTRATYFYLKSKDTLARTRPPAGNLLAEFDTNQDDADINVNQPGDGIKAKDNLELHVADFDITKTVNFTSSSLTLGGGVRYVNLDRQYFAVETGGCQVFCEFILADHEFQGAGPTVLFEGTLPVTNSVGLFMNGRGSLIFGDELQNIRGEQGGADQNLIPDGFKMKPIVETQLGAEWRPVVFGEELPIRAAVESQAWINGGGWDFANGDGGSDWPSDFNFGLLGFNVSIVKEFAVE